MNLPSHSGLYSNILSYSLSHLLNGTQEIIWHMYVYSYMYSIHPSCVYVVTSSLAIATLAGGQKFTKLDLRQAYQQPYWRSCTITTLVWARWRALLIVVWWPNIDRHIEDLVKSSPSCQSNQDTPTALAAYSHRLLQAHSWARCFFWLWMLIPNGLKSDATLRCHQQPYLPQSECCTICSLLMACLFS